MNVQFFFLCEMKMKYLILLLLFCAANQINAQVYRLNQFFKSVNSTAQPYKGKLEIGESTVTFTAYEEKDGGLDSTVTTESILKKKGSYIKTSTPQGAANYEIYLSPDRKEKAAGIYIISILYAANSGSRMTLLFKGTLEK